MNRDTHRPEWARRLITGEFIFFRASAMFLGAVAAILFSPHVLKRMFDRSFSEVDLRVMMEGVSGLREDHQPGRWVVETKRDAKPWEVIVEPDSADRLLLVITAYPVDQP